MFLIAWPKNKLMVYLSEEITFIVFEYFTHTFDLYIHSKTIHIIYLKDQSLACYLYNITMLMMIWNALGLSCCYYPMYFPYKLFQHFLVTVICKQNQSINTQKNITLFECLEDCVFHGDLCFLFFWPMFFVFWTYVFVHSWFYFSSQDN